MASKSDLRINEYLTIPLSELRFRFSQSSGPGGQHVNHSATRVELLFDVANSSSLDEVQRARVLEVLKPYIDKEGTLHLVSDATRSQLRNREEVKARFQIMMRRALRIPKKRRPTTPTRASKERRLAEKRRRSETKRRRRKIQPDSSLPENTV